MLIQVGIIGFVVDLVDVFLERMMLRVFRPWFLCLNRYKVHLSPYTAATTTSSPPSPPPRPPPSTTPPPTVENRPKNPSSPLTIPTEHTCFRLLCHASRINGVMGIINHLQNDTSAKVRVEHAPPSSVDRVIFVVGNAAVDRTISVNEESELVHNSDYCDVSVAQEALVRVYERVLSVTAENEGEGVLITCLRRFYGNVASRKKEKPRKSVVEEAVKAIQKKEYVVVSVKSVMKQVEQLHIAGDGKDKINVGKSALEKTIKAVVADLKKKTQAKKDFTGDELTMT